MLNRLWGALIITALVVGGIQSFRFGLGSEVESGIGVINSMANSMCESAKLAIEIALGLIGVLMLWLGLFAIAEAAGVIALVAKATSPVLGRLLPDVPKDHPAFGSVSINIAMNMLGIDNGALPSGLKAMRELETLNTQAGVASRAQQVFLVYMTTSVTLFPISIISYRMQAGATSPADVLLPLIITGYSGLLVGLLYICAALNVRVLTKGSVIALFLGATGIAGISYFAGTLPKGAMNTYATLLGNTAMLMAIAWFLIAGLTKQVPIFETFVRGASEGFTIAVEIMPYLVGMLLAIGLLKSSGAFGLLQSMLSSLFEMINIDPWWAQMVPHGIMKLFSGSGARSLMIESFRANGVDSLAGHLSAMIQGAFDTTFYVLAVCAAAAKLTNLGHAVIGALLANTASVIVAGLCTKFFF
jgi:spore maturation protein SpmA